MDSVTGAHLTFLVAFLAGIASFASPCVVVVVSGFISYLAGVSSYELVSPTPATRKRILLHTILFICGFTIVFLLLGASLGSLSKLFVSYRVFLIRLAGLFLVVFGLFSLGLVQIPRLQRVYKIPVHRGETIAYIGSILIGSSFAASWSPCIGPILGSILTLAAGTTGTPSSGIFLLGFYSLGLALPFLFLGIAVEYALPFFIRAKKYMMLFSRGIATLLVILGMLFLTNTFSSLIAFFSLLQ